ncbi:MAG TPA: ABC transporter permease, partial [Chitinophagaceae bacterium]|nr:ABC transporter permease [Chitinophagaceae bacterium]
MIKNYFKVAWRNLIKNKGVSFINIGGLAVGMAIAMLIGLWLRDELNFNKHHKNYDKIARVVMCATDPQTHATKENHGLWLPVEDILRNNYGRYFEYVSSYWYTAPWTLKIGNGNFTKTGNFMGGEILDMLSVEMLQGSKTSLSDPHSMVISESAAQALFGNENPINKAVKINNRMDAVITGVYKNLPKNSEYGDLEFIAPFELWKISNDWVKYGGWNTPGYNFLVQLAPNVS